MFLVLLSAEENAPVKQAQVVPTFGNEMTNYCSHQIC